MHLPGDALGSLHSGSRDALTHLPWPVEYVERSSLAARLATFEFGFAPTVSAELVILAFAFLG